MYSDPLCMSNYAKKLAKGLPLAPFFTTPTMQIESLYKLFNCEIKVTATGATPVACLPQTGTLLLN